MTYGWLLHRWTDAYAPFLDSMVLACSIVAQLLLMRREVETWWFWIVVNLMAAPLFFSRELYLTSALYVAYLANALFALRHWRQLQHAQKMSRI
jgi:nicotinamide mononucleotide transporter